MKDSKKTSVSKETFEIAREDDAFQHAREEYLDSSSENISMFLRRYRQLHSDMKVKSGRFEETTFRNLIKLTIDPIELISRKKGIAEARKAAREVNQRFCHRGAYFQAQNDVLFTPLALAHPDTRRYLGTAKNYFSLNPMFRGIRGNIMDASGRGENSALMIELLKRAILPNVGIDQLYGLKTPNPFWGMCIEEVFDSGPGANNKSLLRFCAQFHIGIRFNQTATPWANAFVERWNDTFVRKYISSLPGYMPGMRNSQGPKLDMNKIAVIDPFQYEVLAERFIAEYHDTPHSSLFGSTPIGAYQEYLERPDSVLMAKPVLPPFTDQFRDYCVPWSKDVVIQVHKGMQIDNRFYGSADTTTRIRNFLKQRGKRLSVRPYLDHNDFSYIKICDPETNQLIPVPFKCYDNRVIPDSRFDPGISTLRREMLSMYREMSTEEIIDAAKRAKEDAKKARQSALKRGTPEPIACGRLSPNDAEFATRSVLHASLLPPDLSLNHNDLTASDGPEDEASMNEEMDEFVNKFGVA